MDQMKITQENVNILNAIKILIARLGYAISIINYNGKD